MIKIPATETSGAASDDEDAAEQNTRSTNPCDQIKKKIELW